MRNCVLPVLLALAPMPSLAQDVMVFAAASMKTALDQIAGDFTAETGTPVIISYAGSNTLASQIIAGAPADIFISAAPDWMDIVRAEGLVQEGRIRAFLGNDLVLIGPPSAPAVEITPSVDLPALLAGGKLAMALVDGVPAGQYGKAALVGLGLWDDVAADVAQTDNVRAALALVAAGEAPYGITYASDAIAESGVSLVGTFPADSHPPITYPLALLTEGVEEADLAFFEYLQSPAAMEVFVTQGFRPLP